MSAAAVIILRRKRLMRRFREAGATGPQHAVTLDAVGERHSWIFDQMVRRGVFLRTADGRYFMDDPAALEFLRRQRSRALRVLAVLILFLLLLWVIGVFST